MKQTIDSILFGLIQKNNLKAFSELYKRYWQSVYIAIYLRTEDRTIAKKITTDIFVTMWEKRSLIHIDNSCGRYLNQATKHKVMDWALEENVLDIYEAEKTIKDLSEATLPGIGNLPSAPPETAHTLTKRLITWYDSFAAPEETPSFGEAEISHMETEIMTCIFDTLGLELPVTEHPGRKRFVFPELALRVVTAIMVLIILGGIWELFIR